MQDVEESKSLSSLYDFFDDRKPSTYKKGVSTFKDKEEITEILVKKKTNLDDEEIPVAGTSQGTPGNVCASPSESEKMLLANILANENSSIRSKTSDDKEEQANTGRTIKSDTAFNAGFYADYPDIHGAGDSHSLVLVPNDDEGFHFDIIVETGESDFGDRATTEMDVLQSADGNTDSVLRENDDKPNFSTLDDKTDSDSDSEYGREEVVLNYISETDTDEDKIDDAESGDGYSCRDDAASRNTDTNSEPSDSSEQDSETSDFRNNFDEDGPLMSYHDISYRSELDSAYYRNDSECYEAAYYWEKERESGSEDLKELAERGESDTNGDRDSTAITGTRETFTPYQEPVNSDDPCEGNRPESNNYVSHDHNVFHTRLNKTDGEGKRNVSLSSSFIARNKDSCISEGAKTIGDLILALQNRRELEISQENLVEEENTAQKETGPTIDTGQRIEDVVQNLEQISSCRTSFDKNSLTRSPDRKLDRKANFDDRYIKETATKTSINSSKSRAKENLTRSHYKTGDSPDTRKISRKEGSPKPKKTLVGLKVAKQATGSKQSWKTASVNIKARSAEQSREFDQLSARNLRKGSKPVLPAISKGSSKPANQFVPTKAVAGDKSEKKRQKDQTEKTINQRKPVLGDVIICNSPNTWTYKEPQNTVLPLIPIHLQSNACFRNGQLEVEVKCDDRMYSHFDPLNVKVTFIHKHVQLTNSLKTKQSAYRAKQSQNPDRLLTSVSSINRDIIHQRAQWPPFDTHLDPEASARHKKLFGTS